MLNSNEPKLIPGPIALFGSGETSPSGRRIFDQTFKRLPMSPRVALLETPAGFELNSAQVVGKVDNFLRQRLINYNPQTVVIPARKRGTAFSPDDPEITAPLLESDLIFMGPGSPTYTVRQLVNSRAWDYLLARHRLGGALALASAAAIAISSQMLPVYEIYKVGEDIHWKPGLDLLAPFGLSLVVIPHWNNQDGGDELDTSRCFIGQARFDPLVEMLPAGQTVVGIDERTGLLIDFESGECIVMGSGEVTWVRDGKLRSCAGGCTFPIVELGPYKHPEPGEGISVDGWERALATRKRIAQSQTAIDEPTPEVLSLVAQRSDARTRRDWLTSDALREEISKLGWKVEDTPSGPEISKL
jgi:cyanophycinase-like exopeptidase